MKLNAIRFLFAAYIATWAIHGLYLGTLVRRFNRLRQQLKDLGKEKPLCGPDTPVRRF